MKKYIIILLSFVLSFSFVNCGGGGGGDDDGGGTTPVINKNSLAISTSSLTFDAAAGQQTVNVTANCDWKVTCSATWLTINPTSGNANAVLTLSAQENTITTREATVTVTGGGFTRTISVTQKGAEEKLSVSPQTLEFDCNAEEKTFAITSNSTWTITSDQSWCTVSKSSGNGNENITVKVIQNDMDTKRTANVKIACGSISQTVAVSQNGVSIAVSPQTLSFEYKAGENTVAITSNSSWTVTSDQDWCTVSKSSGSNNENITVKVPQNNSADKRTANVKITCGNKTETLAVTQNGGPLPEVSKLNYSGVTFSEASCTFEVTSKETITECGICYSTTNRNPTINDSKVASSSPANQASKSVKLTGLSKKTTYYIRAYATSVIGTSYTSEMRTFTTTNIPGEDDNGKPSYSKKQGR